MKAKQQCEKGHVATEKDDDHSMGSESVAIFIHEERQDIHQKEDTSQTKKQVLEQYTGHGLSSTAQDTCTVEWNDRTTHPSIFVAHVCPLTTNKWALSKVTDQLFHVDSGATSHC